jgi:SulP family sulfate permease
MAQALPEPAAASATWLKNGVAGGVVSLVGLSFYVSSASLLFQGALAHWLPGAIGAAFLGGALQSALAAWRGSQPLAAAGPEPATVPVLAAMTAAVAASTSGPALLPTTVVVLALAALAIGGAWWGIGRAGAGNLMRYIPYPVIGGFLAAVGWLLLAGGLAVACGVPLRWATLTLLADPGTAARFATGLAIGVALWWGGTRIKHVLFLPAMLLGITVLLHAGLAAAGLGLDAARAQGWLMARFDSALPPWPLAPALLQAVDWGVVAQQGGLLLSAVIVSAIGLLLSVGSLEVAFDAPAKVNHDLKNLGTANLACALSGGLAGGISISRSITNQAAGATGSASGWVQTALCGLALVGGGPVLALIPKPLLGGLLVSIGLGMLKAWVLDSRARVSRTEHLTVLAMLLATALLGFLPAVCIGVLACCVDFALASARLPPVRRMLARSAWPGRVEHGPAAARALADAGAGLRIVELQGVLFFGSATRLVDELGAVLAEATPPRWLLLDFQRVPALDSSAAQVLIRLDKAARKAGAQLHCSGLAAANRRVLQAAGFAPGGAQLHGDIDDAVRAWDDGVLAGQALAAADVQAWLAQELGSADTAQQVLAHFDTLQLAAGDRLFAQSDPGDALYLLAEGRLLAKVGTATVRTLNAGSVVGEMGLFRDALRSAGVVADAPCRVLRLRRSGLQALEAASPALGLALHRLLIRQLAGRLEQASAQAVALSQAGG